MFIISAIYQKFRTRAIESLYTRLLGQIYHVYLQGFIGTSELEKWQEKLQYASSSCTFPTIKI